MLIDQQGADGAWGTTARTAHVLVHLLGRFVDIERATPADLDVHEVIYNGVAHLRDKYDETACNWDGDLQSTAKAAQAIGTYNRLFRYSTQEFFEAVKQDAGRSQAGAALREGLAEMSRLREALAENEGHRRRLDEELAEKTKDSDAARERVERSGRLALRNRVLAAASSMLLVGVIATLVGKYPHVARALFLTVGPVLPLLVGAIIAVGVAVILTPRRVDDAGPTSR